MTTIEQLIQIMDRLRDPVQGCPWDRAQTFGTIVPHTLEEAYEVADTIERERYEDLPGELGDLLFQVVFYARMAQERGWFDFNTVVQSICDKLVHRHPHVFGEATVTDTHTQTLAWEQLKEQERREKNNKTGVLDGIPLALPALTRATKLQKRAAHVGFDWPTIEPVMDKIAEELGELEDAIHRHSPHAEAELGDLLFACVNLARHAGIEPERALRCANRRFAERFRYMEAKLRDAGRDIRSATLAEMDTYWEEAKKVEEAGGSVLPSAR